MLAFPLTLSRPFGISSFANDLRLEAAEARGVRLDPLGAQLFVATGGVVPSTEDLVTTVARREMMVPSLAEAPAEGTVSFHVDEATLVLGKLGLGS